MPTAIEQTAFGLCALRYSSARLWAVLEAALESLRRKILQRRWRAACHCDESIIGERF